MTPSSAWKESIAPDEAERFERHARTLLELQRRNAKGGARNRTLHAVAQAGLEAELTVLPDLPPHARVGLFATPATYRAYVRYSNGHGVAEPDRKPAVRGIGVKIVGVPGRKLIPGLEDAKTQDFLMINSRATLFRNADEFVGFIVASASPVRLLPWLLKNFGFGRSVRFMRQLLRKLSAPVPSLATTMYHTALPLKFGAYAVHALLAPHAQDAPGAKPGKAPDYLRTELEARLAQGPVSYDLRVQFFRDDERTPIEDPSREWSEEDAPPVTLARLTLPKQDPSSPRGRRVAALCERMSFDPWHTTEDFRPLGNMMRARSPAYRVSTGERGTAPEPDGTEKLDGESA
jgi:hypothetical protein